MATTALGERLSEAHRLAQGKISLAVASDIKALFPLWDPRKPSTFPPYARLAKIAIAARKEQSASLALQYLTLYREAEGIKAPMPSGVAARSLEEDAVATSLRVTGPATVYKAVGQGATLESALDRGLAASVGSSIRHARSGGRETTYNVFHADEAALGVARKTDGRPCAFCALLASRGPVYRSEVSAGFKAHDACGCEPEIVYGSGDSYRWPTPQAKEWHQLYLDESTGSGKAALDSFRRAYTAKYKA